MKLWVAAASASANSLRYGIRADASAAQPPAIRHVRVRRASPTLSTRGHRASTMSMAATPSSRTVCFRAARSGATSSPPTHDPEGQALLKGSRLGFGRQLEMVFYCDDQVTANLMAVLRSERHSACAELPFDHWRCRRETLNSIPRRSRKAESVVTGISPARCALRWHSREYFSDYTTGKSQR